LVCVFHGFAVVEMMQNLFTASRTSKVNESSLVHRSFDHASRTKPMSTRIQAERLFGV
jgi:hypothetical protein